MRIAMISHSSSYWTRHYARHFTKYGHAVLVLSFHPGIVEGVTSACMTESRTAEEVSKLAYITRVPRVRRVLREFVPDVVFATYLISNGVAAALAWRGPLVVSAHGGDVLEQPGNPQLPGWARRNIIRFVCRRADLVHAVSEEIVETLLKWDVSPGKILLLPLGVDIERFTPWDQPRQATPEFEMVCTRAHHPVYHNDVIAEAVARLRAAGRLVRCTFVGDGPLLNDLRERVQHLGIEGSVRFLPSVPNERMPDVLHNADIYVSASSSDGTSSSLMEALACGLVPVVSRIRANVPWITDEETGFLFSEGDPGDLARAVGLAIERADVRERARIEGPRLVREKANQMVNNERLLQMLIDVVARRA